MGKQKLSPKAAAAKKKRDTEAANSPARKRKRAENQKERRKYSAFQLRNKDVHHTKDGRLVLVSVAKNRGNFGKGTKNE